MDMKFEMETVREIWNNEDRSHYEVGPDRDGLSCVEIRYRDKDGKICERISFPPELARVIARALELCANEVIANNVPIKN